MNDTTKPPASSVNLAAGLLGWLFGFAAGGLLFWGSRLAVQERDCFANCSSNHVIVYVCAGVAATLSVVAAVTALVTRARRV